MIPPDRPFFLIVGPTKSGTTWIYRYLESRGDLALPLNNKETFFFDKVYDRGFAWYEAVFPDATDPRPRVEVAPSYFHKPEARERILRHLPQARILFMVRDPLDRAVSHYFHYRKMGDPACRLAEMVARHPDVAEAGMYDRHSRAWEELFGQNRIDVLSYDLLRADPDAFAADLCARMGIDPAPVDDALVGTQVNAAALPRNLAAARMLQATTSFLRRRGLHRVVTSLKGLPIKRWVFSNDRLAEERAVIRAQTGELPQALHDDWAAFRTRTEATAAAPAPAGA